MFLELLKRMLVRVACAERSIVECKIDTERYADVESQDSGNKQYLNIVLVSPSGKRQREVSVLLG